MPYTNGVFSRVRRWATDAANGLLMLPNLLDQDADDMAGALNNCLLRDGTGAPTANLPMAGKILTGLGNGANPQDSITFGQVTGMFGLALPGGLKFQIGTAATDANGYADVYYPARFPTGVSGVLLQVLANDTQPYALQVSSAGQADCTVNSNVALAGGGFARAPNVNFFYLAVGY